MAFNFHKSNSSRQLGTGLGTTVLLRVYAEPCCYQSDVREQLGADTGLPKGRSIVKGHM